MSVTAIALSLLVLPVQSEVAGADPDLASDVDIREWDVPWDGRPRDPYQAPDGRVWFVGQVNDYVGVLDPSTGEFERFDLNDGAGPHTVIVAEDGTAWYAGNRDRHIGKIDPSTGEITRYDVPDDRVRDPHTMDFDSQGRIWFTAQGAGNVGRFDPASETFEVVELPGEGYRPYGLVVDEDDRPWVVMMGTNRIVTVDPNTLALREFEQPREETRTRRLGLASDGGLWYADWAGGYIGRLDPASGEIEEWKVPGTAGERPYAFMVDVHDRIWFVETGANPNHLVGFDPVAEEFFTDVAIPSGAGTVRNVYLDRGTNELWFGTDAGTVGRAVLP